MIRFTLNGTKQSYEGDPSRSLLSCLRLDHRIISPKDGCSGEGSCGACTVEIDGKPKLACRTPMEKLQDASVVTMEGLPEGFRRFIGRMFAKHGAVQCGFCSPGFIMRSRQLFELNERPSREDIVRAIQPNLCRCTGYIKIVDALEAALEDSERSGLSKPDPDAKIGAAWPKYQSEETALGARPFVDDLFFDGMLYGALVFSEHARAKIRSINIQKAKDMEGVAGVFTATDIPGERYIGLIFQDWPLMIAEGEYTRCVGDVLAGVVAETEEIARKAAALIEVGYEVSDPVCDMHKATSADSIRVHPGQSNVLETCSIRFGDTAHAMEEAAYIAEGVFETQHVEHAFLETECAVALPEKEGIRLYSQSQGVYVDRKQLARLLGIGESLIYVTQVSNGGGFGGKEDLSVQGHAALFSRLLKKPVKVHLNREESIRMHPKRHPVWMDMRLACDSKGRFTALTLNAVGDTGAYASVGTKVMERVVGHATGGYTVPAVDISAKTVYTNNIPSGAMRGFGVPQVIFALESCIDDLCRQGGFDRWQIRYDNALTDGATTATGQKLEGVGLRKTLNAVKDDFKNASYAGIACGIKNSGVGNGMIDESKVKIEIVDARKVLIHHGWTEMGQGIHTMAIQTLHQETGIDPLIMEVLVDTGEDVPTGMTTSSRGTALLGNAILDAAKKIKEDLEKHREKDEPLAELAGKTYRGEYICDWTCKPGENVEDPKIHFAYGYATQVVILDDNGNVKKVVAAHDAGKIMNPTLFEGQIHGAVHMGLGYALTEKLEMENGRPKQVRLKDLGIWRAKEMPEVKVIGVEEKDPHGPYGAKGIGEIGMVPTAAAVANAYTFFDGNKRTKLPVHRF